MNDDSAVNYLTPEQIRGKWAREGRPVSDNLRDRIAAALLKEDQLRVCKLSDADIRFMADAVIAELGLQPIQRTTMFPERYTDKCHISGCTCGKPKYDRQTEDQMKRPMQQEFVDMAFWDKKEPKITTQTVITISSGNGFSTSELREFLDVAEGNHVPTPDLPVEAIFRPAQNDEPATFILRVTKTLNAARDVATDER